MFAYDIPNIYIYDIYVSKCDEDGSIHKARLLVW